MIQPPFLTRGDTIVIIATARKVSKIELQPAIALAKNWGLQVKLGKTIDASAHQYAGEDIFRTADFQRAIDDPEIKAIWCARGGYGTVRMIDGIDFSNFKENPKWIVGYSDVTILHNHINNLGFATIHGQMCLEIEKKSQKSRDTLYAALFGKSIDITISTKIPQGNRIGEAKGILAGGNLSVLYSNIDSPSEISYENIILFIEDLDEMLYHIDRMLQNLKRSGRLANLAGLLVGGMSDMRDNTILFGKTPKEIILEAVAAYDYPVCFNVPAGHIEDNRALVFGKEINLEVFENRFSIRCL